MTGDTTTRNRNNSAVKEEPTGLSRPEDPGTDGRSYYSLSGWVSDDPYFAVHAKAASTTFQHLHEAFAAGPSATTPPIDEAL